MNVDNERQSELIAIRRTLVYMAILFSGVVFYFAKDIVMPIVLGLLFTLTLSPIVRFLQKFRIPAPVAAIVLIVSIGSLVGVGVMSLTAPIGELLESLPRISERLTSHLSPYKQTMDELAEAGDQVQELAGGPSKEESKNKVVLEGPGLMTSAASSLAAGVTSLFLAMILSVFMLGSGNLFYEKLVTSLPLLSEKKKALRIVFDIERSVSRYLLTITMINVCLGCVVSGLLFAYGAPNVLLWGVMAAVLNFLPFLGAIAGTILLAMVSFGTYDTLSASLIPPLIYYGCSALEGNLITPYIVGRRLQLNIVAVFLSVACWGWLWGLAGALMAVPILVLVNVLCEHIHALRHLGHFISGPQANPVTEDT